MIRDNSRILTDKLEEFIRKYYRNRLIRGTVITVALLSALYLLFVLLEYAFRFGQAARLVIFYSYLGIALASLGYFILVPLLKMRKIGKRITYEYAARVIGDHFPAIADKLLNALQLMQMDRGPGENLPLLVAGIDQKIEAIRPFPFTRVINIGKNLRYLRYALPPLIIILAGIVVAPSVVSVPAGRIVRYNTTFVKELPYSFAILNSKLEGLQQSDFELRIAFTGEEIPAEVFIHSDGTTNRMKKEKGFVYSHTFKSLQGDVTFTIVAGELTSPEYRIRVIPRPIILSFETILSFPAYTGRAAERVANNGDLNVPEGTKVTWELETRDVDEVMFRFADGMVNTKTTGGRLSYSRTIMLPGPYSMIPKNAFARPDDSIQYRINVIADAFPSIYVQENTDSSLVTTLFFRGTLKDDYGFSKLLFHYEVKKQGDTAATVRNAVPVPIEHPVTSQVFFHMWEPGPLITEGGEEIRYFFEIWDNDGIHGPKATRSDVRLIKSPTLQDIMEQTAENEQNIIDDMESSLKESESVSKTIDDLNRKMVEKSTLNFQERKQLEELLRSNEKIMQTVEEIRKKNEENIRNSSEYLQSSQDILEKQRRLNELMDQLLTEDMKKLMKEIRDLLDKVDKSKLTETLDKMKKSQKDIEQQLDRNLQLFKQLEFDRQLEQTIRSLRENAQKQQELSEKARNSSPGEQEALKMEQQEVKAAYDSVRKQLQDLDKKEKELENPPGLKKTASLQDSISKSLKEAEEKLKEGNPKNASDSQKKSAGQMDKLASQLEQLGMESEMEGQSEDAAAIRMILESLVRMSFEQEDLITRTAMTNRNDPKFQEVIYRQKEVKDKLKSAEDSLIAISRRQFLLAPVITREIKAINTNLQEVVTALNNRNIPMAQNKQQLTMTAINNLAILLEESLNQMNQNMQSCMKGGGQKLCSKPSSSGGSSKIKGIKEMQQKMSEQLKKMKDGLEKEGQKQAGQKKSGQGSVNEQIARMAAEQEAIRNEMQRYKESLEEQGLKDGGNAANAIREMEQNERDLINKQITQETIMRQQKIMTRLLESEKAEMEREKQEKRESREQKEQKYRNFNGDLKYNNLKTGGNEILEYKTAPLNLYYRNRVNSYMIKIGQ